MRYALLAAVAFALGYYAGRRDQNDLERRLRLVRIAEREEREREGTLA